MTRHELRNCLTVFVAAMCIMCAAGCPLPNGPSPTPDGQFHVVILYESSANNSRAQLASLYSPDVRSALNTATGQDGWRMFDKDIPLDYATDWKPLVEQAKASQGNLGLPVIVFFGRGKPQAFMFPDTPAATVALIQKQRG